MFVFSLIFVFGGCSFISTLLGDDVKLVTEGAHADHYAEKLGKTSYVGLPVPAGKIWTAKGGELIPEL